MRVKRYRCLVVPPLTCADAYQPASAVLRQPVAVVPRFDSVDAAHPLVAHRASFVAETKRGVRLTRPIEAIDSDATLSALDLDADLEDRMARC